MSSIENIVIREPITAELDQVVGLRHAVLDPARIRDEDTTLTSTDLVDTTVHYAAFLDDEVVATVRLDYHNDRNGERYEIRKLATREDCRGRGIATHVLRSGLEEAERRGVTKFASDVRDEAIGVHSRLGFESTGTKVRHSDGVSNVRMTKGMRDE